MPHPQNTEAFVLMSFRSAVLEDLLAGRDVKPTIKPAHARLVAMGNSPDAATSLLSTVAAEAYGEFRRARAAREVSQK